MSKWLEWRKALFRHQPGTPDYFIDDDGTFYCSHNNCADLAEHQARVATEYRPARCNGADHNPRR